MQTSETGTGQLHAVDGEVWLLDARYELTIDHAQILGGLPAINGAILNPPSDGFAARMLGVEAVLRLEDGREWDCVLADQGGTLRGRGEGFRSAR
jgi:hypothetical protein